MKLTFAIPTVNGQLTQHFGRCEQFAIVETEDKQIIRKATITEDIMPGVIGLVHGWEDSKNANIITKLEPNDPVTGYPALMRNIACRIRKATSSTCSC